MAMNNRNRIRFYAYNSNGHPQQMSGISGDDNEDKCEIAIRKREEVRLLLLGVTVHSSICVNCRNAITNEIRPLVEDPSSLQLDVLTQTSSHRCLICNAERNVH